MSTPIQQSESANTAEPAAAPETNAEASAPACELPLQTAEDGVTIAPSDLDQLERDIAEVAQKAHAAADAKPTERGIAAVAPKARARDATPIRSPGEIFRISPDDFERLEREVTTEQARIARVASDLKRRLRPEVLPPPPSRSRRRDFAMIVRSAVVIGLISLAIPAAFGAFTRLGDLKTAAVDQLAQAALSARAAINRAVPARPAGPPPRLAVEDSVGAPSGDAPINIRISGQVEGGVVILTDYPAGAAFSVGDTWGEAGWLIPVAEIGHARIRPPEGFSGVMQLSAALYLIDGSFADRQRLQISWPKAAAAAVAPAATPVARNTAVPVAPDTPAPRKLGAEEIALLLHRSQELLESGDISSARLMLRRAAEAGDARAALALAATYDPRILRELRVYGSSADLEQARAWYEKAIALGSREAPQRLQLLVSESR
jgi:hypothetical protein